MTLAEKFEERFVHAKKSGYEIPALLTTKPNEIMSWLTAAEAETREDERKRAHDSEDGWCCACEYDIIDLENRIAQERAERDKEIAEWAKQKWKEHEYRGEYSNGYEEMNYDLLAFLTSSKDEK